MRIFLQTFGCTFNKADEGYIKKVLNKNVFCKRLEHADAVILNTCGVKNTTENRMFFLIEKYLKANKKVVVTGCLPKINFERLQKYPVSIVDSNSLDFLPQALEKREIFISSKSLNKLDFYGEGFTAIIPICEGCLSRCSFCATKNARGNLRSYSERDIVLTLERAVQAGKKEILLTAQDCGCYGLDIGTNIGSLLEKISKVEGEFKVRLGMANPQYIKKYKEVIAKSLESPIFFQFLHLPVQSGSDEILRSMHRGHTAKDFSDLVFFFKEKFPDITISTDIIVGFPGEKDDDHLKTVELLNQTRPAIVNLSKFYPRLNTPAKSMKKVDTKIIKKRSVELSEICRKLALENNRKFLGREIECLILDTSRAFNYLPVSVKGKTGDITKVRITGFSERGLKGEIV